MQSFTADTQAVLRVILPRPTADEREGVFVLQCDYGRGSIVEKLQSRAFSSHIVIVARETIKSREFVFM